MAASLISLKVSGPGKPCAEIGFKYPATLVRGPSDTGKSYIRDCLWALLGGEKNPKKIPQSTGYDKLHLQLAFEGCNYELRRALAGGETTLSKVYEDNDGNVSREDLDEDVGDFLVKIAGAAGKQLLRNKSKRGGVTGGDLRHWFLISQPNMISEEPTYGDRTSSVQRIAAFHLFITGSDDSAIELSKSNAEKQQIAGKLLGLEESLQRVRSELPHDKSKEDVASSLERVDNTLNSITQQYNQRLSNVKSMRERIYSLTSEISKLKVNRDRSLSMIERFELLDKKYKSDSERLGATWEGVSMFQALEKVPCPLCGTSSESYVNSPHLDSKSQDAYRRALRVELNKIVTLRAGLLDTNLQEQKRVEQLDRLISEKEIELDRMERDESERSATIKMELSGDPKILAVRRSELSEWLSRFDDEARLVSEIDKLKAIKSKKTGPIDRGIGDAGDKISALAIEYLNAWGFVNLRSVEIDNALCDLILDGRSRLEFGAGKRSIFLAALIISVMTHALREGHPHWGFVLIDSPLKAYADPKSNEQREVALSTVTDRFYNWLAEWDGPGQIIILENQEIKEPTKSTLNPIEFVGESNIEGRKGFYPYSSAN